MNEINGLSPVENKFQPAKPLPPLTEKPTKSFKEVLQEVLDSVNNLQIKADLTLKNLIRGEATETDVVIAFREAQIAFELLMQIRNKLVDSFQEIQRMRI